MSVFHAFRSADAQRESGDAPERGRARRIAGRAATVLACLFVLVALDAPDRLSRLSAGQLVRIPVEALVVTALVLVLPGRARRWVAAPAGALLGVLVIFKGLDMGFDAVLVRPFNPVFDVSFLRPGFEFVDTSVGRTAAIGAAVLIVLLMVALPVLMALAVLRLTRLAVRHRTGTARSVAVLGTVWVASAALGVQAVPGVPLASGGTAGLAYDHARQVRTSLKDRGVFAKQAAVDAFRNTPPSRMLTGLRGKDVILAFVESYGRSAVEHPEYAPQVDAVLDAGTRQLKAAGFGARSGYLTSSTAGGGSWLAHSTLLSGLWIDNQQRYRTLTSSSRFTLTRAFGEAGWRTLTVQPAITRAWPEASFYGYDKVYDDRNLGYKGPRFSYATMPDQYTLNTLQRDELAASGRKPVMAEIALVSSHAPWASIPSPVPWNAVGDGSVFDGMGKGENAAWPSSGKIRGEYRKSIEYTLNTLVSYMLTYGTKNTVLVFLGDHQPAPSIAGQNASRDVPVTVVARDPAVLDRISGWGWQDGLRPASNSPVWPMSTFRDRFLAAFGSTPSGTPAAAASHR
ncbi:sulfatase [Actinomadura violacea]|uniref:Sulfatase n=1 Tax=Actinomadura violacea TaxID=2819934 RepID=A0ABS3S6X3_9ACTN|nr:sulfatase [Actinomadura violacea]MBO2464747.1 sulfatase [Actinomadura violacea]